MAIHEKKDRAHEVDANLDNQACPFGEAEGTRTPHPLDANAVR
jgi:hypothetical protein